MNIPENLFFEEDIVYPSEEMAILLNGSISTVEDCIMKEFPNPIMGTLNLEYSCAITENFKVSIYNLMNNEMVYAGSMPNSLFTLDVSHWQSGFYSIVVTDNNGELIYKSSTKIKN